MHRTFHLRLFSLLLCFALLFGLGSAVRADDDDPFIPGMLQVEGVSVTAESLDPVYGYFRNSGMSYDAENKVLTLTKDIDGRQTAAMYSSVEGLTIRIENNITITNDYGNPVWFEADVTITGPGRLTVRAGYTNECSAIRVGHGATLTLEDTDLVITGPYGLWTAGESAALRVTGSRLLTRTVQGGVVGFDGGITLTDCELVTEGAMIGESSILASDGTAATEVLIEKTDDFIPGMLMVQGVSVTPESMDGYFRDSGMRYDFENKVLTFTRDLNGGPTMALYSSVEGLTVCIENDLTMTCDWGSPLGFEANVRIIGPGRLTVLAAQTVDCGAITVGHQAVLTLEDCELEASGTCGLTTGEGGGGLIVRDSGVHILSGHGAVVGFDGGIWLVGCELKTPGAVIGPSDILLDGGPAHEVLIERTAPAQTFTVSFDLHGHGRALDEVRVESGLTVNRPGDPIEEGWVFGGWYTDPDFTELYDFELPVTSDLTLHAKWTEKADEPFSDVDEAAYYAAPVNWAVARGITNGTGGGRFSPAAVCTRAQIVTFLWRAKGCPEPESSVSPFTDVTGGYYYKAVLWAVEQGITNGTSADKFSPDAGCTRAQVVTLLWRAEGKPEPTSSANPFADVQSDYYFNAVLWAVSQGITNGTSADKFSPDAICTRGQIVTFLYRDLA